MRKDNEVPASSESFGDPPIAVVFVKRTVSTWQGYRKRANLLEEQKSTSHSLSAR